MLPSPSTGIVFWSKACSSNVYQTYRGPSSYRCILDLTVWSKLLTRRCWTWTSWLLIAVPVWVCNPLLHLEFNTLRQLFRELVTVPQQLAYRRPSLSGCWQRCGCSSCLTSENRIGSLVATDDEGPRILERWRSRLDRASGRPPQNKPRSGSRPVENRQTCWRWSSKRKVEWRSVLARLTLRQV